MKKSITTLRKLITNLKLESDNADLQFTHCGRKVYDDSIDYTLKLTIASLETHYSELYHISYYPNHLILNKLDRRLEVLYADPDLENKLKEYFRNRLTRIASDFNEIATKF